MSWEIHAGIIFVPVFLYHGGRNNVYGFVDVTTAAVAKEALEGHCVYDGGYCKLHLTYSRHTDLNVKVYEY